MNKFRASVHVTCSAKFSPLGGECEPELPFHWDIFGGRGLYVNMHMSAV